MRLYPDYVVSSQGPGLDSSRPTLATKLFHEAGPWLVEQRMAKDLLGRIVSRRRMLTPETRQLSDMLELEY
ncbi:hypothetical protein [Nocardia wallacei]|uniref:hypothetical protein n=1 Tax=Nocardia wallacei TaxID=480035 RepID=UPI002454F065|nr:hypothetical protein [Nocardia wallacei]